MAGMRDVIIEASWKQVLAPEFEKPYWKVLTDFVRDEYKTKKVYPPPTLVFNAFAQCPFDQVRVVILGQDPYHGAGQAHGLSFSVPDGVRPPPSLQNIYKELQDEFGCVPPTSGDLTPWAAQGVLLLNSTLTVVAGQPASHKGQGWETFTDVAIEKLSEEREHIVFMLWGSYAKSKRAYIDESKHCVLETTHPSPYSAHDGFLGCKHFNKANAYLEKHGEAPIRWTLNQT